MATVKCLTLVNLRLRVHRGSQQLRHMPQDTACIYILALTLGNVHLLNALDCLISSVRLHETLQRNLLLAFWSPSDMRQPQYHERFRALMQLYQALHQESWKP